ncbi:MAG: hypothetical protein V8R08_00935 [Coriobacteriales bacterium]
MNNSDIQSFDGRSVIDCVREQLANFDLCLASTDIEVKTDNAIKLPLDSISALGVGLSSLPAAFRSVTTTISMPTLFRVTDKKGAPIGPEKLNHVGKESAKIGSYLNSDKHLAQARLHPVDPDTIQSVATMPYDPTALFMAAALAQINQKLDSIQQTVSELFEYVRQKDKAELRGDVKTLKDILDAYRHNWNNKVWRCNAHMKVMDIKQESAKAIIHLRAQIRGKLDDKKSMETRSAVDARLDEVLDRLKEYQIATYLYAFASFLEPMLSENFDEDNLGAISARIRDYGNEYRELYTDCYNAIEENSKSSLDSIALDGLAGAFAELGSFLEKTPVGSHTSVDERFDAAGKGIEHFNEEQNRNLVEKLHSAKVPDVLPFQQSLEAINTLYNRPHQIAADNENVYILPE